MVGAVIARLHAGGMPLVTGLEIVVADSMAFLDARIEIFLALFLTKPLGLVVAQRSKNKQY